MSRDIPHITSVGRRRCRADSSVRQVGAAHGQFDLFQQGLEAQAAGLVDHQPQGAAFVVFAHIHHTAGEKLVFQLRHGNQKVVGKVELEKPKIKTKAKSKKEKAPEAPKEEAKPLPEPEIPAAEPEAAVAAAGEEG